MERWKFYSLYGHWLWAIFFLVSIVVGILGLLHCGPGVGRAEAAARTASFVMQALCSDDMTVKECAQVLEKNAAAIDNTFGDAGAP